MKLRSLVAVATVATVSLTACGGGSSNSNDDFVGELADICDDTNDDMDAIDAGDGSFEALAAGADEAIELLTDTRARLSDLEAPDGLDGELEDFIAVVDDQIDAFGDFRQAARDQDDAALQAASDDLDELTAEGRELSDELGVPDCVAPEDATTDTTDTTEPGDTVAPESTAVPPTEAPSTTTAETVPLTLPPTVAPTTAPPATQPATTAPSNGQLFSVVDLTTLFLAPQGFSLVNSDPAATQSFIDIVASIPELNTGIQEMGVGVLLDDQSQTAVATIVVGVAIGDAMPAQWKDMLCATGVLRTSEAGYTGVACPGDPESSVYDIFTMTEGDTGLSVVSVVEGIPADLVVDAFFEANFT
ncbi:MAG: hypothetical protein AB7R77_20065 [Ilumatobacteraceae bacterium]